MSPNSQGTLRMFFNTGFPLCETKTHLLSLNTTFLEKNLEAIGTFLGDIRTFQCLYTACVAPTPLFLVGLDSKIEMKPVSTIVEVNTQ